MPSTFRSVVFLCAFYACCLVIGIEADGVVDPKWIKPGALDRWQQKQRLELKEACESQVQPTEECNRTRAPEPAPSNASNKDAENERLALIFYRKLVQTLFAHDVLQIDPFNSDVFSTDLSLKITSRQLDRLFNEASSMRNIDATVSEILEQSKNWRRKSILQEHRCERLYNFLLDTVAGTLQSILPLLLLVIACYVTRTISRYTRLPAFVVFLLLILSITVCNKWKECNENLVKKSQNMEQPTTGLFGYLFGGGPSKDGSMPLAICDPLQVLVEATVSMQAVYFKALFKQFMDIFDEHTRDAGILQKLVVALMLLGVGYIILTTMIPAGIHSGFQLFGDALSAGLRISRNNAIDTPQQQPSVNLNIHIGQPRAGICRPENQRIEVVSEEQLTTAIREPAPVATKDKRKQSEINEAELTHAIETTPLDTSLDTAGEKQT